MDTVAAWARQLIDEALPLARRTASGRVRAELGGFYRDSAPFATLPSVRDTRDAIRELTAG